MEVTLPLMELWVQNLVSGQTRIRTDPNQATCASFLAVQPATSTSPVSFRSHCRHRSASSSPVLGASPSHNGDHLNPRRHTPVSPKDIIRLSPQTNLATPWIMPPSLPFSTAPSPGQSYCALSMAVSCWSSRSLFLLTFSPFASTSTQRPYLPSPS